MKTILIILFSIGLSTIPHQADWKLQKNKDGIKVYTRDSQRTSKGLKDSRVEMTLDIEPEELIAILSDISRYTEWIPKCNLAYELERTDRYNFVYYSEFRIPMVQNRDNIFRVKAHKETKDRLFIEIFGEPDYLPEKDGLVRMPYFYSTYELKRLANGKTHILHEYSADVGGNVPSWLVNTSAVDSPYETFENIKELLGL